MSSEQQLLPSRIKSAWVCDWNWALGYGIGKDVKTGKDVFIHHSHCLEALRKRGPCTGFSWINDKGEKISGPIGENRIWLERRDIIYYVSKPEFPNIAFDVSLVAEDTITASLPGTGTIGD